jgi:hypothetical protein
MSSWRVLHGASCGLPFAGSRRLARVKPEEESDQVPKFHVPFLCGLFLPLPLSFRIFLYSEGKRKALFCH